MQCENQLSSDIASVNNIILALHITSYGFLDTVDKVYWWTKNKNNIVTQNLITSY